ncbi:MAG TPA: Ig-like domain-containing protein [Terriglobales bacterium]|jgi:hypothetical protein|nr:Ig-like domain-containing protein [Terriglobales bacterium]
MLSTKRKLQLLAAFTALLLLAVAVGCTGFFVNPALTTITISPPTPSIEEGKTLQLTATGTYDDGSTKTITGDVSWSSNDESTATVNAGLVTGVAAGTTTITASSVTGVTGSTSVTITLANLLSIDVEPQNLSLGPNLTQNYTATGHFSSGPDKDITTQVTWTTDNTSAATISNTAPNQGLLTTLQVSQNTTVKVRATSGTVFGEATLTVTP